MQEKALLQRYWTRSFLVSTAAQKHAQIRRRLIDAGAAQDLWSTPGVGVEAARQLLRLGAADKVVDVGCGDGRFLLEAAKRGASGLDWKEDAERAEAARGERGWDVRTCNALDEAEWSKAFDDGVTCAFLYLVRAAADSWRRG